MSTPYVCLRCRDALKFQSQRLRLPIRRSFIPLNGPRSQKQRHAEGSNENARIFRDPGLRNKPVSGTEKPTRRLRYSGKELPGKLWQKGTWQREPGELVEPKRPSGAVSWSLEDFQRSERNDGQAMPKSLRQFLEGQNIEPRKDAQDQEPSVKSSFAQKLGQLEKSLKDRRHVSESFAILDSVRPIFDSLNSYERILLIRDESVQNLFTSLITSRLEHLQDDRFPTISQTVELYNDLGIIRANVNRLEIALTYALNAVLQKIYKDKDIAEAVEVTRDIFRVWRSVIGAVAPRKISRKASVRDWSALPSIDEVRERLEPREQKVEWYKLFKAVLQCTITELGSTLLCYQATTTLFCYERLRQAGHLQDDFLKEVEPFIAMLSYMFSKATLPQMNTLWLAAKVPGQPEVTDWRKIFGDQCQYEWKGFRANTQDQSFRINMREVIPKPLALRTESVLSPMGVISPKESKYKISPLFSNLRKATKEGDVNLLTKHWKRRKELFKGRHPRYVQEMYAEFLWAFVQCTQIEKALEVWATLQQQQVEPTLNHWTAMLEACRKLKDQRSLTDIWGQMQASGLRIGNTAWATYISILLHCRDWQEAVKAVTQLSLAWESWYQRRPEQTDEAASDSTDEYKPSIRPINAAVSGLLALRKRDVADSVLAFAQEQNLQPTIETFNIQLKPAVQASDMARVQEILGKLHESGHTPDIITYTILIDGVFRGGASGQSTAEQNARVEEVFADMDASGIKAGPQTYATILHALLSTAHSNLLAVSTVLNRMREQKVQLSTHICSILSQHYFNSTPPDLAAIDALWEHMEKERTLADHVFFDRMIENYAKLGETDKVFYFLKIMPARGKLPGWLSLGAALKALADKGDWDAASQLVETVENQSGFMRLGVNRGWKGEEEYKALLEELRRKGYIQTRE